MNFPAHLVWDWNGTLLDDAWLCVEVVNGMLAARARPPISADDFRAWIDFPIGRFYRRAGLLAADDDPAAERAVMAEFLAAYEARDDELRLHPGLPEALDALTAAGATHSVLSAYGHEALNRAVGSFGLAGRMRWVNGLAGLGGGSKVELGRAFAAGLPYPPGDVLLVGDTVHDAEVAAAMGARCVLVACGYHSAARLAATGHPVLAAAADLPAWLAGRR